MNINTEIILNVFIALFVYNIILSAIGKTLLKYFLDSSSVVQKEKKTFEQRLKEKLQEK